MNLSKNSILYKIAYGYSDLFSGNYKQRSTNLCFLFWRVLFSLLFIWPIIILVVPILLAITWLVLTFIMFLFGGYAKFERNFDDSETGNYGALVLTFEPISSWPEIMGTKIWPLHIILSCFCFTVCGWTILNIMRDWAALSANSFNLGFKIFLSMILSGFVVILLGLFFKNSSKIKAGESYQLFREYFRAKKEKFCPIISFR